ncbi:MULTISPECIES: helix-turn-helix domain-containing protein [Klebsiella pneumoniae complex]|uniref:helix-turn-helix domain-containing protein n=1 Tax=Klebsiella pneumoniae complex TaxID=3390273 RepID=UPI000907D0AA|nr:MULTISPECIES: helix-turn-helix domain-containing protein [Klebsiella]MDA4040668.1 helix-turn-helix domain-containing protein [Klebsiella pneumoniae]MDE4607119.1 helix-turn-helix domain-containing protein [Klebsiella pneumoniae]MDP0972684.1 helix-turn-helix domain-containing protein [Klebsiella pneumoniae]MDP0984151.1 helix-turn-helix domain-containing protein [Klebsiella pneumoniae]MDP0996379.1 helix-turn-helix domain-containing protein [Klebsiella pneumoniae]
MPSDDWKASSVRRSSPSEHQYQYGRRMLENGATRQQIADVIGVGVKTIYKYFPAAVRDQGFLPFP